jgi:type II secretory pathway pseudopilin PulG
MKTDFKTRNISGGFTVLETLVAISILVLSITATFTAAQSGLSSAIEAKDQVRAFYLAQEAVEMVRNKRDENSLVRIGTPATSWLEGLAAGNLNDKCAFGNSCTVDAPVNVFTSCGVVSLNCPNIDQDPTTGMYGYVANHAGWTSTGFNRKIILTQVSANEIIVTVTVTWNVGPLTRSVKVNEVLRDWQ